VRERRDHAVVITGGRENGRGVISIRLVELIVVVLRFAEVVDDVSKEQAELRNFTRIRIAEIGDHLVRDFALGLRPARAAAIAGGVEGDLFAPRDRLNGWLLVAEHIRERQRWLGATSRRGKRQRLDPMLGIQLIDELVCGRIRGVLDLEDGGIGSRLRLREDRRLQSTSCRSRWVITVRGAHAFACHGRTLPCQ
jgi:hypothetical protein